MPIRRRSAFALLGSAALGLIAVVFFAAPDPPLPPMGLDSPARQIAESAAPTVPSGDRPAASVGAVTAVDDDASSAAPAKPTGTDADADVPAPPPSLSMVATDQLAGWGRGRELADRFAAEAVDPAWAPQTTGRLNAAVSTLGLPILAVQAECRTTMCRVEVAADYFVLPRGGYDFHSDLLAALREAYPQGGYPVATGASFGCGTGNNSDFRISQIYLYPRSLTGPRLEIEAYGATLVPQGAQRPCLVN